MFPFEVVEIEEGLAKLVVPDLSKYSTNGRVEPAWAPVFYNPHMSNNRAISIIAVSAYALFTGKEDLVVCEPLTGTGVRAIRYSKEVPAVAKVIAGDISRNAVELAKYNVEINNVDDVVEVYSEDANVLLSKLRNRCDVVDIDPFGSPQPFIDSAFRSVKDMGLVCVTATDLAVLTGRYPHKCLRRYHARVFPVPFGIEVGIRVLLGFMGRVAASYGLFIEPMVSWYERHYYRICVLALRSPKDSIDNVHRMGYVVYEEGGGRRRVVKGYPCAEECGIGPLWVDKLGSPLFLRYMVWESMRRFYVAEDVRAFIYGLYEEASAPPLYYLTYELGLSGREPSRDYVVQTLRYNGFDSWITHFDSRGFKTSAEIDIVRKVVVGSG